MNSEQKKWMLVVPAVVNLLFATARGGDCVPGVCDPSSRARSTEHGAWSAALPLHAPSSLLHASPLPGRCRVFAADGSTGSGTLIHGGWVAVDGAVGSDGIVLTCAHLFRDCQTGIVVSFPSGVRCGGALIARDEGNDLAAVRIVNPGIAPVDVADPPSTIPPSTILTAGGFGGDGVFHAVRGAVVGYATSIGATSTSAVMTGSVGPGDSGGGVVNEQKQLVGVVWGCRDGQTYFTCGAPLRSFFARLWPKKQGAGSKESGECDRLHALSPILPIPLPPAPVIAQQPQIPPPPLATPPLSTSQTIGGAVDSALSALSLGKWVARGAVVAGPIGAVAGVGAWIAVRRIRRKVHNCAVSGSATRRIAIDTPPLPQQVFTENHYVPYETDSFARAHTWASEQVVRKYPGTTEVFATLDSLIKQFLSGKKQEN